MTGRTTIPGWEGTTGPFPAQYASPHVYARDVQSGAGNCVCGRSLGAFVHLQAAPGVGIPARLRDGGADPRDVDSQGLPRGRRDALFDMADRLDALSRTNEPTVTNQWLAEVAATVRDRAADYPVTDDPATVPDPTPAADDAAPSLMAALDRALTKAKAARREVRAVGTALGVAWRSPDCRATKHAACSGDAWDDTADHLAPCGCSCHENPGAR